MMHARHHDDDVMHCDLRHGDFAICFDCGYVLSPMQEFCARTSTPMTDDFRLAAARQDGSADAPSSNFFHALGPQ